MNWLNIDMTLWCVLGLVWLAGALFSRRTVQRESLATRARYLAPVIVGAMLLFTRSLANELPWLEGRLWPQSSLTGVIGTALTAAGVAFAIWARLTLGRLWSGTITLKEGHRLVTNGPYALSRHPIYTGFLFAWLGTAIVVGAVRGFLGLFLSTLGFLVKLSIEDRLMASQFGEEHRAYCQRVRRLIPFIY